MNRIAIPAVEFVTADIYTRVRKITGWRASNAFTTLSRLAPVYLIEALSAAGALTSTSLGDYSLAIAITVFTKVLKRIKEPVSKT